LTVREAALLQTFPEDWEFCGGIESQSLQVGNAVPVKLGRALAKCLFKALADHTTARVERTSLSVAM
jgi:DNA (cytosine-5)-methyltransferase 1